MAEESTGSNPAGIEASARPRLLDQVRETIRRKYYSRRTEEAYVHWIKRSMYDREIVRAGEREGVRR